MISTTIKFGLRHIPGNDGYLTLDDVAYRKNCNITTVKTAIRRNELTAMMEAHKYYIKDDSKLRNWTARKHGSRGW